MIRTVVIDDEVRARETISEMLKLYCHDIELVAEADSVETGIETIEKNKPQLVLLDIQMTEGTGFDLLKHFKHINFNIIFITAYAEYAITAFKYSAFDYLLKPIDPDELIETINRVKEKIDNENSDLKLTALMENINSESEKNRKIVLKTSDSIHLIDVINIIRCESSSNYTIFYFKDRDKLLVSKTLKEFEQLLPASIFFRTHQSHLVNVNYINHFKKTDGGYIVMEDNSSVPVSSRKKEQLLKFFENL